MLSCRIQWLNNCVITPDYFQSKRKDHNFFFFFPLLIFFLWLHLRHMEVGGLEVESELQPQPPQHQIQAASMTYSSKHRILNPLSKAMDQSQVLMNTSQVLSVEPQWELQIFFFVFASNPYQSLIVQLILTSIAQRK